MGRWTKGLRLEPFNKYMITFQKKKIIRHQKQRTKKRITLRVKFAIIREVFVENKIRIMLRSFYYMLKRKGDSHMIY